MLILYNLNKQKEIKSRSLLLFTCNIKTLHIQEDEASSQDRSPA